MFRELVVAYFFLFCETKKTKAVAAHSRVIYCPISAVLPCVAKSCIYHSGKYASTLRIQVNIKHFGLFFIQADLCLESQCTASIRQVKTKSDFNKYIVRGLKRFCLFSTIIYKHQLYTSQYSHWKQAWVHCLRCNQSRKVCLYNTERCTEISRADYSFLLPHWPLGLKKAALLQSTATLSLIFS